MWLLQNQREHLEKHTNYIYVLSTLKKKKVLMKAGVQVGLLARTPGHLFPALYSHISLTTATRTLIHHLLPEAQIQLKIGGCSNWLNGISLQL